MDWEFLFRQGLLGFSVFACGMLVYLAQMRVTWFVRERDSANVAHAMLDLGTAMVLFAVVQSILVKIPRIPITWQGLLYFGGLVLIVFGTIGIALSSRRRRR